MRSYFEKATNAGCIVFISSVVKFELWYGVFKSAQAAGNAQRLQSFMSGPVRELSFGHDESQVAGQLRATLEAVGSPIGSYDLLIAGQALHYNLVLVTSNVREFGRIKGLVCEDWTR